jgi:hypothetical protein
MGSFRRLLLWGVLLTPVALLPGAFIFAKIWLNHHLNRDLVIAESHIRMVRPLLGWNFNFNSDSLEILSPNFVIRTGPVALDIRLWQTLVSFRPRLTLVSDTVLVCLPEDTASEAEKERRRAKRKTPVFPNIRIPIPFSVSVDRIVFLRDDSLLAYVDGVRALSQGPKGIAFEAERVTVFPTKNASTSWGLAGSFRVSARWFGKSLRYQVMLQNANGDFFNMEGGHRKSNLRLGNDSLSLGINDIGQLSNLVPKMNLSGFSNLKLQCAVNVDSHTVFRSHFLLSTPAFFAFGAQHLDGTGVFADSLGRVVVSTQGDSGENAYLQGRFSLPFRNGNRSTNLDSSTPLINKFSATLSGYTRNLHLQLGGKQLPADIDIRRLTVSPGLFMEADVRTKDSSTIILHAFPQDAWAAWKVTFAGKIHPRESWAHAWTDTNIAFQDARVKGEITKGHVSGEAWFKNVKAYGAVADSLYLRHEVNKTGYNLNNSRLFWRDAVWPITGKVDWGRLEKGPGNHHQVTLSFQTKHPRYGHLTYVMPRKNAMEVRSEQLVLEKLPYPRLATLFSLKPVLTAAFDWDWQARTGLTEGKSTITYGGQTLGLDVQANWDAQTFSLEKIGIDFVGAKIQLAGDLRLRGRQFYEVRRFDIKDVQSVALDAERFDASKLSVFFGPEYPLGQGMLNGRLAYTDSTGFNGTYEVENLDLKPIRNQLRIRKLSLIGEGESLLLTMRTVAAPGFPWFNDSISLKVGGILAPIKELSLQAVSDDGLNLGFSGRSRDFHDLDGSFALAGKAMLPGNGGEIREVGLAGHLTMPFTNDLVKQLIVDSGTFQGQYAVPSLDTPSFHGSISVRNGRLSIPDLHAENSKGPTLFGAADCDFNGPPKITAQLRGNNLDMKWPGFQKLVLSDAEASLSVDTNGLFVKAKVGQALFQSSHAPVNYKGSLENLSLSYALPPALSKDETGASRIPKLTLEAKMGNFLFQHKLGFRDVQHFFRSVKVDKRKKRVKPMEMQIKLEAAGPSNRIETDILRMNFTGDLNIHGIYPYTLLSGEFSALSGELGQSSQSYDITDFDLKWQNATVEEGRVSVEGSKRLRYDCKPDTKRTCNVFIKLEGRLDEMAFSYDTDCGGNSGGAIEPAALINSVSRGCYSDQYVAGAGGGNYGEAVVNFLEPTINAKLSSVGNRYSLGWIKSTQVSGIGTMMSKDNSTSEPIAIGLETKEKWGLSLKGKAGFHPEAEKSSPWENKGSLEWRPSLEKVAKNSTWKRRVRDRIMLVASVENRPEVKVGETENNQIRKQVGISYHYKFWDLW